MIDMNKLKNNPWEDMWGARRATSRRGVTQAGQGTPGQTVDTSISASATQPWSIPSWFPQTYYKKWQEGDPNYQAGELPNMPTGEMYDWYRSPQWGGGTVYNPYWGWQDRSAVKGYLGGLQSKPTWEQFSTAPFTRQTDSDWKKYFPNATVDTGGGGGGSTGATGYGGSGTYTWPTGQGDLNIPDPSQYYQGYGQTEQFPYPQEWDFSRQKLGEFAQHGYATDVPLQWDYGSALAGAMGATGMPTSYDPWYQQAKGVVQTDVEDAIKQAAEQAGLRGTRWSTPLGRTAQDIAGRRMAELGAQWTGQELGALEAARGRQMESMPMLYQYGAGETGLAEAAKGRGMQALGMLPQLGQMSLEAPQQYAANAMQMGQQMQGMNQAQISPYYQEFLRTLPESSPWLQAAMGITQLPFMMAPQMYQPSGMGQFMGGLGSLLPFLMMLRGGK